jgi:UDP-N-acetylglucosamine--N-acetylmuramyl-(pentapeptide) pyrophosphoryl-undecaprenol N-acetylglucosamine transferase
MANAYAISDLVISRSGALTLSEITACGKPAILIPFSNAAGDHQTKNAETLAKVGAAEIIHEKKMNDTNLLHLIMKLIHNKHKLTKMSRASKSLSKSEATKNIVDYVLRELN